MMSLAHIVEPKFQSYKNLPYHMQGMEDVRHKT